MLINTLKKFGFFILLIISGNLYSQSVQWTKTYGTAGTDGAQAMVLTEDGGIVMACIENIGGIQNATLKKVDAAGNVIWTRAYGYLEMLGGDMKRTFDGGFILTGRTLDNEEAFLIKTDSAGNLQWEEEYNYPVGIDSRGHSVWQTTDSGYIVAGQTWIIHGQFGNYDMFVFKTDKNGNAEWMKIYFFQESGADIGLSVQQLPNSGYIIGGFTQSALWASYIIRIDDGGNIIWQNTYEGPWQSECYEIQQTPDRGFIMTGLETTFDTDSDFLIAKLDSSGNMVWKKTYASKQAEFGESIQQLSDGYLFGGTSSNGAGSWDMYVVRTTFTGDTMWTRLLGGESDDRGFSALKSPSGDIYSAGWTYSFGAGSGDIFLARLTDMVFGINNNNTAAVDFRLIQNYPNPFNPVTAIRFNAGAGKTHIRLNIYNALGELVATLVNGLMPQGEHEVIWDAKDHPSGVYFYTLSAGDFYETKKMVLVK